MFDAPEKKTFGDFIQNEDLAFNMPKYQRWYVWGGEQWSILCDLILSSDSISIVSHQYSEIKN